MRQWKKPPKNKMKKTCFIILLSVFCINIFPQNNVVVYQNSNTNSSQKTRTIDVAGYTTKSERKYRALCLWKNGKCAHEYYSYGYGATEEREGTYYIDNKNIIHLTWDNGLQETASLSYDNNGKAVMIYRNLYYSETYFCIATGESF